MNPEKPRYESPEKQFVDIQFEPSKKFSLAEIMVFTAIVAGLCVPIAFGYYHVAVAAIFVPLSAVGCTWLLTERLNTLGVVLTRREQLYAFCFCAVVISIFFVLFWLVYISW